MIEPLMPPQPLRGRKRRTDLRAVIDGIFYLLQSGCQWGLLPKDFPPKSTVHFYFKRFTGDGTWAAIHDALYRKTRDLEGRDDSPSYAIIDSQSVKTAHAGTERGFDGGKLVKGRKRHIVVDTLGLLLAVLVHSASLADSQQAPHLLKRLLGKVPRLRVIFADKGYLGTPAGLIWRYFGWLWQVVHREQGQRGFVVLKKRWIVERTFSWFGGSRRLSKDYEYLPEVSEAMVLVCSIRVMIRRLA